MLISRLEAYKAYLICQASMPEPYSSHFVPVPVELVSGRVTCAYFAHRNRRVRLPYLCSSATPDRLSKTQTSRGRPQRNFMSRFGHARATVPLGRYELSRHVMQAGWNRMSAGQNKELSPRLPPCASASRAVRAPMSPDRRRRRYSCALPNQAGSKRHVSVRFTSHGRRR